MDPERGHAENRKIGLILNETDGVKDFVVDEVAWDCLYDELIGNNPNGTSPDQSRGEGDAGLDTTTSGTGRAPMSANTPYRQEC